MPPAARVRRQERTRAVARV